MGLKKYISDNRWPIGIVAFFILLAISNVFLFVTAMTGQPGKVTDTPYQDSLEYEQKLAEQRLGMELGLNLKCKFRRKGTIGLMEIDCHLGQDSDRSGSDISSVEKIKVSAQHAGGRSTINEIELLAAVERNGYFLGQLDIGERVGIWFLSYSFDTPTGTVLFRERRVL
jgi:nitrogen fixation protein FixH